MGVEWPCVSCTRRDSSLCGALLGKTTHESRIRQQPTWQKFYPVSAGQQIIVKNQIQDSVSVLCVGWAFRFFQLANGRRQILDFLLPGDILSAMTVVEGRSSSSVAMLTHGQISGYSRAEVRARCVVNPAVTEALAQSVAEETAGSNELLAALGQRAADERIAYLFLRLMRKLSTRSVIRENRYPLPLRQQHIAEAVGLTPVHVSRVLGQFRERGLISFASGILEVHNRSELERIGQLD